MPPPVPPPLPPLCKSNTASRWEEGIGIRYLTFFVSVSSSLFPFLASSFSPLCLVCLFCLVCLYCHFPTRSKRLGQSILRKVSFQWDFVRDTRRHKIHLRRTRKTAASRFRYEQWAYSWLFRKYVFSLCRHERPSGHRDHKNLHRSNNYPLRSVAE